MDENKISKKVMQAIQELNNAGMGSRAIARATGVSHVTILKWARCTSSPTVKNAEKFLECTNKLLRVNEYGGLLIQSEHAIINDDIATHFDTLVKIIKILKRDNLRSKKLLHEVEYLFSEEFTS